MLHLLSKLRRHLTLSVSAEKSKPTLPNDEECRLAYAEHVRAYTDFGRRRLIDDLLAFKDVVLKNEQIIRQARAVAAAVLGVQEDLAAVLDKAFWLSVRKGRLISYESPNNGTLNIQLQPRCHGRLAGHIFLAPWRLNLTRRFDSYLGKLGQYDAARWPASLDELSSRELWFMACGVRATNRKAAALIDHVKTLQAFAANEFNEGLTKWNRADHRGTSIGLYIQRSTITVERSGRHFCTINVPDSFHDRLGEIVLRGTDTTKAPHGWRRS